jgi:cystathionine beta-lyase
MFYEKLYKIIKLCNKYNVLLISDEAHCDLILGDNKFISLGTINKELLQNVVILTAPTKTFNIAGIRGGNAFIWNKEIKQRLNKRFARQGVNKLNIFYITATKAGYLYGKDWLSHIRNYIFENYLHIKNFFNTEIPEFKIYDIQATYLMWVNYSSLKLSEKDFFDNLDSKVILSKGSECGNNGIGFFRMNIACPRILIDKALQLIKEHINQCKI